MEGRGTGLAVGVTGLEVAVALLLFYIAWTRPDIQERGLGGVLGALMLVAVLIMQIFFFKYPEDRRPIVCFLVLIGLFLLPGMAFIFAQATTGFRMALDGPDAPSPLFLVPYILVVALVFIRLSTWATTYEAPADANPGRMENLRQQILALNDRPELPFVITPGKRSDEVIMDWKYADATWFDLMRVHHISNLSRLVIRLDDADHTMRVRQYQSEFDAAGGMGSLRLSFSAKWGEVTFYEFQQETVFGLQIADGVPTGKLHYTYRYDIDEMRQPLQKLARENGWAYKSVSVFAKWLTG